MFSVHPFLNFRYLRSYITLWFRVKTGNDNTFHLYDTLEFKKECFQIAYFYTQLFRSRRCKRNVRKKMELWIMYPFVSTSSKWASEQARRGFVTQLRLWFYCLFQIFFWIYSLMVILLKKSNFSYSSLKGGIHTFELNLMMLYFNIEQVC